MDSLKYTLREISRLLQALPEIFGVGLKAFFHPLSSLRSVSNFRARVICSPIIQMNVDNNPNECSDDDLDTCDDCSNGTFAPSDDGFDFDENDDV